MGYNVFKFFKMPQKKEFTGVKPRNYLVKIRYNVFKWFKNS